MKHKISILLVTGAVILAQLACNLPASSTGGTNTPDLPAPNKTLTALFAITPADETETATLPPVVTATAASGDNNSGGGQAATATSPAAAPTQTPQSSNPTATNTPPAPTATSTSKPPVPTATVPNARTRVQVIANYLSTPPTLDGDWSEWKDITKEYPANSLVYGASNWTNQDDLSASFHVGWDNNYLYIAVKVHDDKYVQNATGADIYKGDSVEILLNSKLSADYYYNQLSPDDFQLGISPGRPDVNSNTEAYLWFPSNVAGSRPGVKIAARAETGGYRLEAAIPWNVFEMTPTAGSHVGFVLSVSDNDDTSKNAQQSMVSNDPDRSLVDPTTWGDLQLVK